MKLRPKIVCLILVVFLGYLGASFLIQRRVILPSFVALEREMAVKNVERCRDVLTREIEYLKVTCQDWGWWDDSYQFMADKNETFITSTLTSESFRNTNLNLIYYLSPDGTLFWGKVYDLSGEEVVENEPVFDDLAGYPELLRHSSPDSAASGIVPTRHGPMLIASLPILTSGSEGPARGALLMGRLFTEYQTAQIAEQTKVDLSVWPVDDPALPEHDRNAMGRMSPGELVMLQDHEGDLDGYTQYRDVNGDPILLMRAHLPSQIIARGTAVMHFAALSICVAGLVTMLTLLIAMQWIVVNPLGRLTRHTGEVGKTSNLTTRIAMNRSDEIGVLADTLDRMVEQLSHSRAALAEVSRAAGKAEVASRVLHNVGNVLNSVNVSAETALSGLAELPIDDLGQVAAMLKGHADDPGRFLAEDPKGRLIPEFLGELSEQMTQDRGRLTGELRTLTEQVNHIKSVVSMQQENSRTSTVEEVGSLAKAVEGAIQINGELIKSRGVRVTRAFQDLPAIWFDRHMLTDIVINLVSNAVYAVAGNPEGSRDVETAIRVSDSGDRVLVVVTDNGVGIGPENLTRVFNHGFTTRADGHGFGLHSAALTAKKLGGSLEAQSDGPGRGASFTLTLPLKTVEAMAA